MALPYSRDYDPIDTGPLPAPVVAAIQDAIVRIFAGDRDDIPRRLAPIGQYTNVSFNGSYAVSTSGGATIEVGLEMRDGERIKSIGLRHYGNGVADITMRVFRSDGTSVEVAELVAESPAAAWANSDVDLGAPHTAVASNYYYISITLPATSMRVGELRVTTDIPYTP